MAVGANLFTSLQPQTVFMEQTPLLRMNSSDARRAKCFYELGRALILFSIPVGIMFASFLHEGFDSRYTASTGGAAGGMFVLGIFFCKLSCEYEKRARLSEQPTEALLA